MTLKMSKRGWFLSRSGVIFNVDVRDRIMKRFTRRKGGHSAVWKCTRKRTTRLGLKT